VVQEINSRPEVPKEAARVLRKKIGSKEAKEIMLALELLDQAMLSCGLPLHS
jgi:hypothetical protein